MNRLQLEHIVRAAGDIAGDDEIIILGSTAVLSQFPDLPEQVIRSREADIFPKNKPELAALIDGSIGELSPFHQTFGSWRKPSRNKSGKKSNQISRVRSEQKATRTCGRPGIDGKTIPGRKTEFP
jgi:hypothetical protein